MMVDATNDMAARAAAEGMLGDRAHEVWSALGLPPFTITFVDAKPKSDRQPSDLLHLSDKAHHGTLQVGRSVKVALGRTPGYGEAMPRPLRDLTTAEKRHLHSLEGRMARLEAELKATRREWAELVEEAGQAAVARELRVSRQAVADRLRRIRANREERSGRR